MKVWTMRLTCGYEVSMEIGQSVRIEKLMKETVKGWQMMERCDCENV